MPSSTINAQPVLFSPSGLCDSLDETNTAAGGMAALTNLIPDPTTRNMWGSRPAGTSLIPVVANRGIVVIKSVGDLIYGMRNSLSFPGFDEPFIYNLVTNSFVTVHDIVSGSLPITQSTSGDWEPPTIAVMGVYVIVTHPGFNGTSNFIGWFDTTDPNNVIWHAGNLASSGGVKSLGPITGGSGYVNGTYFNVPFVSNSVLTFGAITGGAAYVNGTYFNVPLTGGTGSHATADIVVAGGMVTSVTLDHGGVLYTVSDVLSASNTFLGGSGAGFSVPVASISSGSGFTADVTVAAGSVASIVIRNTGMNYNVTDDLTASNTFLGGSGSGFYVPVSQVFFGAIQFTTVPSWVAQFSQRAWFGVNPSAGQPSTIYTDVLFLNCSNANQALTYEDNVRLTAGHGLPLNNQLGGIIQALLVFKSLENIYQVTGDAALGNLTRNSLNVPTGTNSPWSIVDTPKGVLFKAPDGIRLIDFNAHVSDPIGIAGVGVVVPFLDDTTPTRVAAACNANVYRISVQPISLFGNPSVEYWYDLTRNVWSGPHTLPARCIVQYKNTFITVPRASPTQLFQSDVVISPGSVFIELGAAVQFQFTTNLWKDPGQMRMMNICVLTINMALSAAQGPVVVSIIDENGSVFNSKPYAVTGSASLWGSMIWGTDLWGGSREALRPRRIDFNAPIVYRRKAVQVTGNCGPSFQIEDIYEERQMLGYVQGPIP